MEECEPDDKQTYQLLLVEERTKKKETKGKVK